MPTSKTKQLAKKLGLVKKGYDFINGFAECSSKGGLSKKRRIQLFSYIIVLDFESTCWKSKKGPQEIIEFPCVLVDVMKGQVISEFQQYVQPQERPVLSSFCTELTGIKQEQVDEGVPLPTCLMLFKKWIKKLEEDHSFVMATPGQDYSTYDENLCAIATWTDWDLDVCLKYECQRKQIKKPNFFTHWIDLKATYKNFYERKPTGLKNALMDLGMIFEGREHCGLDDARNTAMLCIRLINDGCILKITKSIQAVEPITNLPSTVLSRPCQLPQKSTDHTPILDNDSFNIPTEAWLDISIPEPVLAKHDQNEASKDSPISTMKNDKENSLTIKSIVQDSSNNDLITSSTNTPNPHIFNPSVSPFLHSNKTTPVNRRTSTPIVTNYHGNLCSRSRVSSVGGANSSSSLFKTPNSHSGSLNQRTLNLTGSSLTGNKVTPPMCRCGKRTKRKIVNSEGPNEGKPFYCCCFGRQRGCGYFEWELSILKKFHEDYTPELLTSEYD